MEWVIVVLLVVGGAVIWDYRRIGPKNKGRFTVKDQQIKSVDGEDPVPLPNTARPSGSKDASDTEVLGIQLAEEAKSWTEEVFADLRRLDGMQSLPEQDFRLELYILHVAAFTDATMRFGVDGCKAQAFMWNHVSRVATSLEGASDWSREEPSGDLRAYIQEKVNGYLDRLPTVPNQRDLIEFGKHAYRQLTDQGEADPLTSLALVSAFQNAREGCHSVLRRIMGAPNGTS